MPSSNFKELLARAKEKSEAIRLAKLQNSKLSNLLEISYNQEQKDFISIVTGSNNAVLIGAAGTGKTTTMKGAIAALLQNENNSLYIPSLLDSHKYLPINTPGIIATSFTRRSVNNLKKAMPADMVSNCITIHKLLEFAPYFYEILDNETGKVKKKMEFIPTRSAMRPLDSNIKIVILDEASTISVELHNMLISALPHDVQFIYLGDLNQLPPVFGSAILGFKGNELEKTTVELKHVYRQALESPIIKLAHRILSGNPIKPEELSEWNFKNQLTIHPWKKKISADNALLTAAMFFKKAIASSLYNPEEDIILIPFNKSCGTEELNKHIANYLAKQAKRPVYEIRAGFNKIYLSAGDIIMYDKSDAVVSRIVHNEMFSGTFPQTESKYLDYWGHKQTLLKENHIESEKELEARIDAIIESHANEPDTKSNEASHIVYIRYKDNPEVEIELSSSAEINNILLAYSITVHKSQGSEWRKVFCLFHQSHATMIMRELLYTAVTRAREELYIICEPETFINGIERQKIKGETLKEKFEWFKGKFKTTEVI